MKCRDCNCCRTGWFESMPDKFACLGTKEPFEIDNLWQDCILEPAIKTKIIPKEDKPENWENPPRTLFERISKETDIWEKQSPYVGDDGIYVPTQEYARAGTTSGYRLLISKEMFVEAYNKWIKGE